MSKLSGVALDLANDPTVSYAVIHQGKLLPVRFKALTEAFTHLEELDRVALGGQLPHPRRMAPRPMVATDEAALNRAHRGTV